MFASLMLSLALAAQTPDRCHGGVCGFAQAAGGQRSEVRAERRDCRHSRRQARIERRHQHRGRCR